MRLSVLMSVYAKEKAQYLDHSLTSILEQSLLPDQIVLVEDGPVGEKLEKVIETYRDRSEQKGICFTSVKLPENQQLGRALQAGLEACTGDLVARMDSDDIAKPYRLKMQAEYMKRHPDIAAAGGAIAEFREEGTVLRTKSMPSEPREVRRYARFRNPLNHMTVIFRKEKVLSAGGYEHFPGLEDYYLWSKLLANGDKLGNIDEVLCDARIGENFAGRRGGKEYFRRYLQLRKYQYEAGLTDLPEYVTSIIATFLMTRTPGTVRNFFYGILRKG